MRFLGIGEECDLGDMYHRLMGAGHEVRVHVESREAHGIYAGMVPRVDEWEAHLPWIRSAGAEGIIIFETAKHGQLQDHLRREGFGVIGGSAFGDRLEADRSFGQAQLQRLGLRIADSTHFTDFAVALEFLRNHPARYVFKGNGASTARTRNYIGELDNAADMVALLSTYQARWRTEAAPDFVLMRHVEGVEVGVGAYFNGKRFLTPACLDWEHKRFFPGDMGELTGEMGTIVTYSGAEAIFAQTLAKMTDPLRESGYCGYINLNLIANEDGLWPLEFTSRFGYPGYAICEALHRESWDSIFMKMLRTDDLHGEPPRIDVGPGFAAGVVLTVPPFPYAYGYAELSKGLPISFREPLTAAESDALHFCEVEAIGDYLVTSGMIGYVGVATGIGEGVADAAAQANRLAGKVVVPNLRYRKDIGERVVRCDLQRLKAWGYVR